MRLKGKMFDVRFVKLADVKAGDEVIKDYRTIADTRASFLAQRLKAEEYLKRVAECEYTEEERNILVRRPVGEIDQEIK